MTHKKVIIFLTVFFFGISALAGMVTPEDPYHRSLNGGNSAYETSEKTSERQPASENTTWGQLKSKVVNTASYYWNYSENKKKEAKIAAEKAKKEEEKKQIEKLAETLLPSAEQGEAKKSFKALLQETKAEVGSKEAVVVSNPGRKGTSDLKGTNAGVPVFDLVKTETKTSKDGKKTQIKIKVESIPKLDIGQERSIVKSDFLPPSKLVLNPVDKNAKALKTPKTMDEKTIAAWTTKQIDVVAEWKGPKDSEFGLGKIVTENKVQKVDVEMTPEKVMEEIKSIHPFNRDDRKMLMALILNQKGDVCHIASGLFNDLVKVKKYEDEANFHLGVCAHKMGFHSEAVTRLVRVINKKNSEYLSEAIENLVEELPAEYEPEVAKALTPYIGTNVITEKAADWVNYIIARTSYKKGQFNKAISHASKVKNKHSHYHKAQYIKGISLYAKKDKKAEAALETVLKDMKATGREDNNLIALININLGRMKFLQKRYEAALANYKSVPKNHPVWVDALIEQGWIQLNTDDAPGAIGNMYSLHSPYFRSVYMPESWVVRTIGYIDICQYGDAYRSLTKLEEDHAKYVSQVGQYLSSKPSSTKMYNTVKNYIRGKSHTDVDGLPAQVIREIARHKKFLNHQNALNTKEDELAQYKFIYGIINSDIRELKSRRSAAAARKKLAQQNIAKIKDNPELEKNRREWQASVRAEHALVRRLSYQIDVYQAGKDGFRRMRKVAENRIEKDKSQIKRDAGQVLLADLKKTQKDLYAILEGNEFLRYEIFAGSGEDIRYQAAGGKTVATAKIPANVKPQKILNWQFDGEYWEDEIGSYRSTLRNNCPKRARSTASVQN